MLKGTEIKESQLILAVQLWRGKFKGSCGY